MKINSTYAVNALHQMFIDGDIEREVMEELTNFVLTYSIYIARVRQVLARDIEMGMEYSEVLVELSHDHVLNRLIQECNFKRGLVRRENQVD